MRALVLKISFYFYSVISKSFVRDSSFKKHEWSLSSKSYRYTPSGIKHYTEFEDLRFCYKFIEEFNANQMTVFTSGLSLFSNSYFFFVQQNLNLASDQTTDNCICLGSYPQRKFRESKHYIQNKKFFLQKLRGLSQ